MIHTVFWESLYRVSRAVTRNPKQDVWYKNQMNSWGSSTAQGGSLGLLLTAFYALSTCLSIQSTLPRGNMLYTNTILKKKKKKRKEVYIADFLIPEKAVYWFTHSSRNFFQLLSFFTFPFPLLSQPPDWLTDTEVCINWGHRVCISKIHAHGF